MGIPAGVVLTDTFDTDDIDEMVSRLKKIELSKSETRIDEISPGIYCLFYGHKPHMIFTADALRQMFDEHNT